MPPPNDIAINLQPCWFGRKPLGIGLMASFLGGGNWYAKPSHAEQRNEAPHRAHQCQTLRQATPHQDVLSWSHDRCGRQVAQQGGVRIKHGTIAKHRRCGHDRCDRHVQKGRICIKHGVIVKCKRCSHDGCGRQSNGVCIKHGPIVKHKHWVWESRFGYVHTFNPILIRCINRVLCLSSKFICCLWLWGWWWWDQLGGCYCFCCYCYNHLWFINPAPTGSLLQP